MLLNVCIQFYLIMLFFIVLKRDFSLTDYGDSKYICGSAVTVWIPTIQHLRPDVGETFCSTEQIPTGTCSLFYPS